MSRAVTPRRLAAAWAVRALLCGASGTLASAAAADVKPGDLVENVELPMLEGGKHLLLSSQALANVFVFFRPGQDHSLETLKAMNACELEFAGKRVHWVAVVSSSWPAGEVEATVRESGIRMPVLVDVGDALYGRLGIRLHPAVGVADGKFRLVAYEPFQKVNYCDRIRAEIRYALGEMDRAEVARVENPDRALFPDEMKGAVATRYVRMGEVYFRAKLYDKAAAEARRGVESDPLHAPAQFLLGDALSAQGKCAEAASAYDAAVKIDAKLAAAAKAKRDGCALLRK